MRKLISILAAVLITVTTWAQSPQKMSYQAVIRDAGNNLVTNRKVGMRISIIQGYANGKPVYTETQTPTTNANGLVSIEIGGGAGFDAINWGYSLYFVKTQTDPTGGTTYTITGISQLLSVPYALYAKTAEGISGKISVSQISDLQSGITKSLLPPSATTQVVTNVQPSSATLNGKVNAKNLSAAVSFEWGTTTSYGNEVSATPNLVTGTSDIAVSANLTGLQLATIYHYRIKAVNAVNVIYSGDMLFSTLVVDAKSKGAKGDGVTDDTAALQAAITQVGGTGGTVLVPAGTYMINAVTALNLRSDMTFRMADGVLLKAIPNNSTGVYNVLKIDGRSNVNIVGGTIIGERNGHTGTVGEWGMGIGLNGAVNVTISNITIKDCWGDGIYVGYNSFNIKLDGVTADNNRRQGMSVVYVDGMIVENSVFKKTGGTAPQGGIDIEPNSASAPVKNVQIRNSQFLNNAANGIIISDRGHAVTNVTVVGNTITYNGNGGAVHIIGGIPNNYSFTNNTIVDNAAGFSLELGSTGNTITGNTVTAPILITGDDGGNIVGGNILKSN